MRSIIIRLNFIDFKTYLVANLSSIFCVLRLTILIGKDIVKLVKVFKSYKQ